MQEPYLECSGPKGSSKLEGKMPRGGVIQDCSRPRSKEGQLAQRTVGPVQAALC